MTKGTKQARCAVYTRVSTEQGLEQDFNSLDAQYEASRAYIQSQKHAGWTLSRMHYDDGGYSGGSMERPALQRLLNDIRACKIDIVVVYKVDRLTRSLADFAKLVELFDAHDASFVSVTQHFNTTTSMGRLTLNVLLSFAQFEREVTSERIRDKVAASKRKGLWVGGKTPLGYAVRDRKVIVVEEEAERVRAIFRSYQRLGSLNKVLADLRRRGIVTKVQKLKDGRTIGGIPFTRGPLSYLLRNRFYVGEVVYKGEVLPGQQTPLLDRALFDAVQAMLARQHNNRGTARAKSAALLIGRIFDDRGNRMGPSHTRRKGRRYRYYVSLPLNQGRAEQAGSICRIPAAEVENVVAAAVRRAVEPAEQSENADLLAAYVARVDVEPGRLVVRLKAPPNVKLRRRRSANKVIRIPWQKPPSKRRREIIMPASQHADTIRPIRADARARLVCALALGRAWLNELVTGKIGSVEAIAGRERCSTRKVNMTISLAFLAPDLVKAAVEGRLPRGIGVARLSDPPAEWPAQYRKLGLPSDPAS